MVELHRVPESVFTPVETKPKLAPRTVRFLTVSRLEVMFTAKRLPGDKCPRVAGVGFLEKRNAEEGVVSSSRGDREEIRREQRKLSCAGLECVGR